MKKLLFIACFAFCATYGFTQIKVESSGNSLFGAGAANNIGFGSGSQVVTIETGATGAAVAEFKADRPNNGQGVGFFSFINGAERLVDFSITRDAAGTSGDFSVRISNGNSGTGGSKMKEKLVVKSVSGFVGVNESNPSEQLHVKGNIFHTGSITMSDKRLKRNVSSFDYGLNEVMKLNPINYTYNGQGGSVDGSEHVGLFAQELQKVAPELVKTFTHTETENANTIEGELIVKGENEFLAIKDSEIKYMLINAIQEQQNLLKEQNEKIAALEEKLSSIASEDDIIRSEVSLSNYDLADLGVNSPNPFNGSTNIDYIVPSNAKTASMNIFGLNGRLLKSISIDHTGEGILTVNASDIPAGTYTYQLTVDGKIVNTKKMIKQ